MYVLVNKYVWKFIKFFFINDKLLKIIFGYKFYFSVRNGLNILDLK